MYKIRLQRDFFETCNKWVKWWGLSIDIKILSPAPELYTCIKSWKQLYKIRNLQQMGKVIRPFCWHQNLVPWGLSAPARGLHVLNHEKKKCIKSDFKDIFLTCNKWMKWQDISVDIKTLSPGGCLPLLMNIYCIKSDFKKIFWNLQHMTEVTRGSCWHQNFVPKGLSAPVLRLYTCINSWKKLYKIIQRIFF